MRLELLWSDGCPSTERALDELRAAVAELGLADAEITVREIRTEAEAARAGFAGSPTILIDGVDAAGAEPGAPPTGLSCRVYRRRDGRFSPTPDPDDLRAALRARQEVHP